MEESLIKEIKKKKEFSELPDSIVERASRMAKGDVKESRALLRKYFGVFLTNRVLRFGSRKSEVGGRGMLEVHMSSKKRDYQKFYSKIFEVVGGPRRLGEVLDKGRHQDIGSVVDLGCGVNGFSYGHLRDVVGNVDYIGVEVAGQLVNQMNVFFKERNFDARAVRADLFEVEGVLDILSSKDDSGDPKKAKSPRVVFMFQVVDALESMKRDFSKELISEVMKNCEWLVISLPLVSLGGGKKFAVKRKWLMDFLEKEFVVERDFEMFGERVICVRK